MSDRAVQPDWVSDSSLRRLNPALIEDQAAIRRLLQRARDARVPLRRGTNRRAVPEVAWVKALRGDTLLVEVENFETTSREQVFLNFELEGVRYLFSSPLRREGKKELELGVPPALYRIDRRDHRRAVAGPESSYWVRLRDSGVVARSVDASRGGLGLLVESGLAASVGDELRLGQGPAADDGQLAEVRSLSQPGSAGHWKRIGVSLTHGPRGRVEESEARLDEPRIREDSPGDRWETRRVTYLNENGDSIKAVIDSVGRGKRDFFVVIPPAWGRTKESTLSLSATILSTAASCGASAVVVRFDGTYRRGESHNAPDCQPPVGENKRYRFSFGVRDIEATLEYLAREHGASPGAVLLVTMSIAAVEARHAIARDREGLVGGWVSVVGAVDPQSMIRVVSGGVDYFAGREEGISFGEQYIQGLLLNVDRAATDAIDSDLAFLDDARRDMSQIRVPVTWFLGEHDAWTEARRVRDVMSIGHVANRRLVSAPVGHQLRASSEALGLFGNVAAECVRMAMGLAVEPRAPSRERLRARRLKEAKAGSASPSQLRDFWRDYLVGHDYDLGIEIVSSTSAFKSLMGQQVDLLGLRPGDTVLDVGTGAGALGAELGRREWVKGVRVLGLDLVREGLVRARGLSEKGLAGPGEYEFAMANLDGSRGGAGLPVASDSVDAILASLVVNYVSDPASLVSEFARVLKLGGRLVMSGMKPDADVSRICVQGVSELRSGESALVTGLAGEERLDGPLQEFISSGARLLDLEEAGVFEFWGQDAFRVLAELGGLSVESVTPGYGEPPQAWIVLAKMQPGSID